MWCNLQFILVRCVRMVRIGGNVFLISMKMTIFGENLIVALRFMQFSNV